MKNRIFCLLLSLLLLLGLSACGESAEETTLPPEASSEPPVATQPPRATIDTVPEAMFGSISGSTYSNTLLGISYELDEEWSFFSNYRMAESNGVSEDAIGPASLTEAVKKTGIYYDMVATSGDGEERISVVFEHTPYLYGETLTAERYAALMLEKTDERLSGIDVSTVSAKTGTTWLCGAERPCMWYVFLRDGVTYYQTQIYWQQDDFMAIFTGTSVWQGKSGSLLEDFDTLVTGE